jgi:hypothetical protein
MTCEPFHWVTVAAAMIMQLPTAGMGPGRYLRTELTARGFRGGEPFSKIGEYAFCLKTTTFLSERMWK